MKKKLLSFLLVMVFLVGMLGIHKQAVAEPDPWYVTETSFVWRDGKLYIKSECTTVIGSDCNIPGSIHYIQIPIWT